MGNKNLVLILGFAILTFLGGKVHAGQVETLCAQYSTEAQYNNCISEANRTQNEQEHAPTNPGNPPVYNCAQYQQTGVPEYKFTQCKAEYDGAKATYDAEFKNYQEYMSAHPNMYKIKELSAAQIVEDVAAKQQKKSDKLKRIANILKTTGTVLMTVGGALIAIGTALLAAFGAGSGLITAGIVILALGAAFTIAAAIVQAKSDKIASEKIKTCEELNKIITKPIKCPDVQEQTPGDHTLTVTDYGFNNTNGTSDIPPFIDPGTGKCRAGAPPECFYMVDKAPKGCFKGKSCMAGADKSKIPATKVLPNGKVSAMINGKQRTFGAEDFADEASMVKAGFSKDQAKQFLSLVNDPNSILAKNSVNVKGELTKGTGIPSAALTAPSSSKDSAGTSATTGMNSKKDEYGPVQEVARTPASAEGLTKDYHGDTIGAEGDNVFKMMNRRYNLKQKQNMFIEQ